MNEFREPIPAGSILKLATDAEGEAGLNEISINSEDRTYLAQIPININS